MSEMKFIVDFMLGRLAKWLRILGYDAIYYSILNFTSDEIYKTRKEILLLSLQERRILLTRDSRLSRKKAYNMILLESSFIGEQLKQLKKELNIEFNRENFFSICTICNVKVMEIDKKDIKDKVPEYVYNTQESFSICPQCRRVYWAGTHVEMFEKKIKEMIS